MLLVKLGITTSLDLVPDDNQKIKHCLMTYGAISGKDKISFWRRLFRFSSEERTLLLETPKSNRMIDGDVESSVIVLPPPEEKKS